MPKSQEPQLPCLTHQSSNWELANTQPKFKPIFTLFEGCTILLLQVDLLLSLNTYFHLAVMIADYVIKITFHCFFGATYAQIHFITILVKHWSNVRAVIKCKSCESEYDSSQSNICLLKKKTKTGMSKVLTLINYIFSTQLQLCNGKCLSIQYKNKATNVSGFSSRLLWVQYNTSTLLCVAVIRAALMDRNHL